MNGASGLFVLILVMVVSGLRIEQFYKKQVMEGYATEALCVVKLAMTTHVQVIIETLNTLNKNISSARQT